MVFITGPRQAGKTTLANMIAAERTNRVYLSWDIPEQRALLLADPAFFTRQERRDSSTPLVVFDELHKYRLFKNYLKGVYDRFHQEYHFIVTGSGRLDLYRRGSDSLAGRYLPFTLWPFTVAELLGSGTAGRAFWDDPLAMTTSGGAESAETWRQLEVMSGFPEPFLRADVASYRRWSAAYSAQLVREDIRDLAGIKAITDLETLYHLLPSKIGSPLSMTSLARDLGVAYNTVHAWIEAFERYFLVFCLRPWTRRVARTVRKERKLYIWDTPRIQEPAARLENMVAIELFRAITGWNALGIGSFALGYLKNKEQQEVDFVISDGLRPQLLVEAKLNQTEPSPALMKFQRMLDVPAIQLVRDGETFKRVANGKQSVLVAPAHLWVRELG